MIGPRGCNECRLARVIDMESLGDAWARARFDPRDRHDCASVAQLTKIGAIQGRMSISEQT
jgi:hypothetical protein